MSTKLNGGGCLIALPSTMSLLVWNCRGLGNLHTGKELELLIRAKDLSIVFLAETWANEARLEEVQRNINFDNLFYVERNLRGWGGGGSSSILEKLYGCTCGFFF